MTVQITLSYETPEAAASALAKLAGVIAPADRPDAGAQIPLPLVVVAPADPDAVFGPGPSLPAAPAPVVALPGVPPTPAPSTAVVAPLPTVPAVAVPATSPVVPSVPSLPAVPTVPSVAAPMAPATPTSHVVAVEYDKTGLPWDDRIHSSPSKKGDPKPVNADGTWRKKRGTAETYYNEIVAQLRAATQANAAAAPAAVVPPTPVAAVAPAVPPAPVVAPSITFGQFCMKYEKSLIAMQKEHLDYVGSILVKHGIASGKINDMMHAPNVVPLVDAEVAAWLGMQPGPAAA